MPRPAISPHPWRRRAAAVGAVALIGGAAAGAVRLTSSNGPGFQRAQVTSADISSILGTSGTISTVSSQVADFQVAGQVTGVRVEVGDKVRAGEVLATVDSEDLVQQVREAESALQIAEADLSENEEDESSGLSGSGSTNSASSGSGSSTRTSASTSTSYLERGNSSSVLLDSEVEEAASRSATTADRASGSTRLRVAQQAVVEAQARVDSEAQSAEVVLAEAKKICVDPTTTTTTSTTSTTSTTTTSTTLPVSTSTSTTLPASSTTTAEPSQDSVTGTSGSSSADCSKALTQALGTQQDLQTDEDSLHSAETTLADLLSSASTGTGSGSGTGTSGGSGGSSGSSSKGSSSKGSSSKSAGASSSKKTSSSGSTSSGEAADSAQQLASDQATIDSDRATLVSDLESLSEATLTSPMSGTVALVDLSKGDTVTAADSDDGITIINQGSYQTTATLTTAQASEVKLGDEVGVVVAGLDRTLTGTVTRIGPVSDDDGTFTYPLVVAMSAGTSGVASGSQAQISVLLKRVSYAMALPTSAVHTNGSRHFVEILLAGKVHDQTVKLGVVGAEYTQVLSGVSRGEQVILADLSKKVPSSSSNNITRASTSGGSFQRGSFTGHGFPGGGSGPGGGGGSTSSGSSSSGSGGAGGAP